MKIVALSALLPLALALGACGQQSDSAAALENAAEQSTPEAADVLRNAAEQGANVQEAMQAAGNAQADTVAPPSQGAKPHAPGDPVPPPKVPTGPGAAGNQAGNSQ
jgi:hypothetical protein